MKKSGSWFVRCNDCSEEDNFLNKTAAEEWLNEYHENCDEDNITVIEGTAHGLETPKKFRIL